MVAGGAHCAGTLTRQTASRPCLHGPPGGAPAAIRLAVRNAWTLGDHATEPSDLAGTLRFPRRILCVAASTGTGRSKAGERSEVRGDSVPVEGLEPPRGCPHLILSQARLPFRHTGAFDEYSATAQTMSRYTKQAIGAN